MLEYVLSDSDKKELKSLYEKVFDESGEVKACGRDACKSLILKIHELTGHSFSVGDEETGMMYVTKLKNTYELMTDLFR